MAPTGQEFIGGYIMNKKGRLLLPTIGLVVLSGIAATSTTFAWFTTVRSATVTMEKAKVVTTDSNLMIDHAHSWNSNLVEDLDDTDPDAPMVLSYSATDDALVTDISGDGKDFYKPIWADPGVTAASITTVTPTAAGGADGKMVDFTIKISRSSAAGTQGLKVYLGAGTIIEPFTAADAEDIKAVAGARMSVYTSTAAGVVGDKIFVHSPVQESAPKNSAYLATGTGAYGTTTHVVKTDLAVKHAAFTTGATNTLAAADYPYIAYLAGEELAAGLRVVDAYVNFRFWVEGEDSDTVNSMINGEFKATLNLYALPHNA